MSTKKDFQRAYRAARLLKSRFACLAATKNFTDAEFDLFRRALRLRTSHPWRGGLECAKGARASGYSFSKAIKIYLRAVRHRRYSGWKIGQYERAAFQ